MCHKGLHDASRFGVKFWIAKPEHGANVTKDVWVYADLYIFID